MHPAHLTRVSCILGASLAVFAANAGGAETWRYYRPGNTGIQGDYNEAIWIGGDGDPYIGGYDPFFEEGGFAKFIQAENRWVNFSNIDYPVIGHPDDTGTTRVSDIEADNNGHLWMGTWRGALRFDPSIGAASIVKYGPGNSPMLGGRTTDIARAPDGTMWFTAISVSWGDGGTFRYDPATNVWNGWPGVGGGVLAIQPKPLPSTGYFVWAGQSFNGWVQRFDTDTQLWTTLPMTGAVGEVTGIAGKGAVDEAGNFWAWRMVGGGQRELHYRRVDGTWVTPPQPPLSGSIPPVWALRAYGAERALLADGEGRIFRFNGATWDDMGIWRPGAYTSDLRIDQTSGVIWASGIGGAARRDPITGFWQRYRITNTGCYDSFIWDLTLDTDKGHMYSGANAAPGVGGMTRFDGQRWTGWNNATYGLGFDWPFPNDNCDALAYRPSTGGIALSPAWLYGIHEWTGSQFNMLMPTGGAVRMVEDSLGRLWALGEYYSLQYFNGSSWNQVGMIAWGSKIQRDPDAPGMIWATTGHEIKRTDGIQNFSRTVGDILELGGSDTFRGLAAAPDGIAWVGATMLDTSGGALIRIDSNTGQYQMLRHDQDWPLPGSFVEPLAVTPDGKLWMAYAVDFQTPDGGGLCSYNPATQAVQVFPGPLGGGPQWGGLPHSQISDCEVRVVRGGYELWLTCVSRGIAVLSVPMIAGDVNGDGVVNVSDLLMVISTWGPCPRPPAACPADLTGDGAVNVNDLLMVITNWS
jgi:streptogramin lyase